MPSSPSPNPPAKGEQALKYSSLKTFNSNICILTSGHCKEVDDIPVADYAEMMVTDEDDTPNHDE